MRQQGRSALATAEPLLTILLRPLDGAERAALRIGIIRILIAANVVFGVYYLSWRYLYSINWAAWPVALALVAAETYSTLDLWLFCLTMWRLRRHGAPPPPPRSVTVDVFISCYNEPIELVRETVRAAVQIRYPHSTYVLDDGSSAAMPQMAEAEGAGYIVRSRDWQCRNRHAKAGNLNNALFQTTGEFILVLDADQIPLPEILHRTLGYFGDPKVAFVQTPQWFYNVPADDPFGSQAPLFYGPIQQGKDGWNAAFFCGSNAVLRRDALMQMGSGRYVVELEEQVRRALDAADRVLGAVERRLEPAARPTTRGALADLRSAVVGARQALRFGDPIQEVTWELQRRAEAVSRYLVEDDLARIHAELASVPGVDASDFEGSLGAALRDDETLSALTARDASPLAAIETVRTLLLTVDVDCQDEAQPLMPMSTISVTDDLATTMRLHSMSWRSVYHHEVLARGLAPEDLRSSLQQRLRWAQGTIQVMLRENPLFIRGLSLGQRLMYLATMWSYLSGFFTLVYLAAPVLYLFFGMLPVKAYSEDFFWHLVPYLIVNQLLFVVVGWGLPAWRGQQYSFALFPLWIQAVTSAIGNVYFGRKQRFVVTPKTRQGGIHFGLIRPQLAIMALLVAASVYGLARLTLGLTDEGVPILVNVFWACYDLLALSVVLDAASYQPEEVAVEAEPPVAPGPSIGDIHGRAGAGAR
ncbi:MAG: glycosyltransferase [Chloroflexi bacterium]|nr:glycosyltransferase [Chloroflexota bacterium]